MVDLYSLPDKSIAILNGLIDSYNQDKSFYKAASVWCDLKGYKIPSDWFVEQMHSQHSHAHKAEKELTNTGIKPTLPDVKAVQANASSLISLVKESYDRAYKICEQLAAGIKEIGSDDPKTKLFLEKFTKIQKADLKELADMLKRIDGIDEGNKALFLMSIKKIFS